MTQPRELLTALLARHGLNPTSLARELQDPSLQSSVHRFLKGTTSVPKPETMRPVAQHFGIDVHALFSEKLATEEAHRLGLIGETEEQRVSQAVEIVDAYSPGSRARSITINEWNAHGGFAPGLLLKDQPGIIHSWKVSQDWVRKNIPHCSSVQNLCIVTGFGNSMRGMYNSGDPLVLDTGFTTVDVDAVYFFRVGNEGFIKILQRMPGPTGEMRIKVKSKNPDYDDWYIEGGMDFQVFGRVLRVWRGENI